MKSFLRLIYLAVLGILFCSIGFGAIIEKSLPHENQTKLLGQISVIYGIECTEDLPTSDSDCGRSGGHCNLHSKCCERFSSKFHISLQVPFLQDQKNSFHYQIIYKIPSLGLSIRPPIVIV